MVINLLAREVHELLWGPSIFGHPWKSTCWCHQTHRSTWSHRPTARALLRSRRPDDYSRRFTTTPLFPSISSLQRTQDPLPPAVGIGSEISPIGMGRKQVTHLEIKINAKSLPRELKKKRNLTGLLIDSQLLFHPQLLVTAWPIGRSDKFRFEVRGVAHCWPTSRWVNKVP